MNSFINKIQEFAEKMVTFANFFNSYLASFINAWFNLQPDTAIEPTAGTPNSEEAPAVQGAGMAGVLGGATKGLAGWAVSSIQTRVSCNVSSPFHSCPQSFIYFILCEK